MSVPHTGFILSRQWRDTSQGCELEFWLATESGPLQLIVPHQAVSFFIRLVDQQKAQFFCSKVRATIEPKPLKNIHNEPVVVVYCTRQRDRKSLVNTLIEHGVSVWENDVKATDRFLMERFITASLTIPPAQSHACPGFTKVISNRAAPADYQPSFKVVSLDIETDFQGHSLYSIAVYTENFQHVFMIDPSGDCHGEGVSAHFDERSCINAFLAWLVEADPDIIIGWHVLAFDIWVLQCCCDRLNIIFTLGRNRQAPHWRVDETDESRRYITLPGRVILDGIELLKSAFYQFERFTLEHVAQVLLGKGKLISSSNRADDIHTLFTTDKKALARYNLRDCQLVWDIFEKTNLMAFAVARSSLTGLALDRRGGSVASFDFCYLPRLHRRGYVAPSVGELSSDIVSPGGFVMRSIPGIYRNVLVLDFKSLYPSIIRTFHVDPWAQWYALHQELDECETVAGFNGANFARADSEQRPILPDIVGKLWRDRDQAKTEHNHPLSQAIKIIMNAFYGVLGSTGCRFFDPKISSSVTLRGHQILNQTKDYLEQKNFTVIYGDTDSVFVHLTEPATAEQTAQIGSQLVADLNQWWREKIRDEFNVESYLDIEFETHYSHFLMPTIRGREEGTKKRYAGIVTDTEGHHTLVFKGLEAVRNDWTPLAKDFQQTLYRKIFLKEPFVGYIVEFVAQLNRGEKDKQLIYRKPLRKLTRQYIKSTPPHIKAARMMEAKQNTLLERGSPIEYIITVAGPEPCAYQVHSVDYEHYINKQLKPIADSMLQFIGKSFDAIINAQMEFFSGVFD